MTVTSRRRVSNAALEELLKSTQRPETPASNEIEHHEPRKRKRTLNPNEIKSIIHEHGSPKVAELLLDDSDEGEAARNFLEKLSRIETTLKLQNRKRTEEEKQKSMGLKKDIENELARAKL